MKKLMKIVLSERAATVLFHKGEELIVDATGIENSRDPADRANALLSRCVSGRLQ